MINQTEISDKRDINFWNELIIIPRWNVRSPSDEDNINTTMSHNPVQAYSGQSQFIGVPMYLFIHNLSIGDDTRLICQMYFEESWASGNRWCRKGVWSTWDDPMGPAHSFYAIFISVPIHFYVDLTPDNDHPTMRRHVYVSFGPSSSSYRICVEELWCPHQQAIPLGAFCD